MKRSRISKLDAILTIAKRNCETVNSADIAYYSEETVRSVGQRLRQYGATKIKRNVWKFDNQSRGS